MRRYINRNYRDEREDEEVEDAALKWFTIVCSIAIVAIVSACVLKGISYHKTLVQIKTDLIAIEPILSGYTSDNIKVWRTGSGRNMEYFVESSETGDRLCYIQSDEIRRRIDDLVD